MQNEKKKAIFLDRDGVLNEEIGDYIKSLSEFKILPDVAEALKLFQDEGYILVVVTNQGGIAKKLYAVEELDKMHAHLNSELKKAGVILSKIYYCPHHPDFSDPCECRKPGSGMLLQAIEEFDIDANQSFIIGDKERDIEAGENIGVKGILIDSNQSLLSIVDYII